MKKLLLLIGFISLISLGIHVQGRLLPVVHENDSICLIHCAYLGSEWVGQESLTSAPLYQPLIVNSELLLQGILFSSVDAKKPWRISEWL